jgi:hypothetical protein
VDVAARLDVLMLESSDEATAARALREAQNLMPRAIGAQVVGLTLVQVNALAMQSDDAASCKLLRGVQGRAKGTRYESKVKDLLESC